MCLMSKNTLERFAPQIYTCKQPSLAWRQNTILSLSATWPSCNNTKDIHSGVVVEAKISDTCVLVVPLQIYDSQKSVLTHLWPHLLWYMLYTPCSVPLLLFQFTDPVMHGFLKCRNIHSNTVANIENVTSHPTFVAIFWSEHPESIRDPHSKPSQMTLLEQN